MSQLLLNKHIKARCLCHNSDSAMSLATTGLLIVFYMFSISANCQTYTVNEIGDTVSYKQKLEIVKDTLSIGSNYFYPGDTIYSSGCETFDKLNGEIINYTDKDCLMQGLWIIKDSIGNVKKGIYEDSRRIGLWEEYDINNELIGKIEVVYIDVSHGKRVNVETIVVKKITYTNGKPTIVIDRAFFAFYTKHLTAILWTLGILATLSYITSKDYPHFRNICIAIILLLFLGILLGLVISGEI